MIVGCYTLDLYCDHAEHTQEWTYREDGRRRLPMRRTLRRVCGCPL